MIKAADQFTNFDIELTEFTGCRQEFKSVHERLADLLLRTIEFIPHPDFDADVAHESLDRLEADRAPTTDSQPPADLPSHLARLCSTKLLSKQEEADLFAAMNYLKFRAVERLNSLDRHSPDEETLTAIENDLAQSAKLKDRITRANIRLVIAAVKRFVTPATSFDDMLSDGLFSLIQAVEKFDVSRGFRFSTYAYRAIAHNSYRAINNQRKEHAQTVREPEVVIADSVEDRRVTAGDERRGEMQRSHLASLMHHLDRRERFIIRSRYALGWHRKAKSFQALADRLGVSKERVRQLEQRAVSKLRNLAQDLSMAEPVMG